MQVWIPITEKRPEEFETVWISHFAEGKLAVDRGYQCNPDLFVDLYGQTLFQVSAWMPIEIPEPYDPKKGTIAGIREWLGISDSPET